MNDLQRTDEWYAARAGKITASRIADMMAKTKAGWGASRAAYAAELIAERLTGQPVDGFTSAAMQWGIDTEPQALAAYSFLTDCAVDPVGFVPHPDFDMGGASPDGLVGADGLVEVKCPNSKTHIEYFEAGNPPRKYLLQMQWQMACTERAWCDFVSFDPRIGEPLLQTFVTRVERDDDLIAEILTTAREFSDDIDARIAALKAKAAA